MERSRLLSVVLAVIILASAAFATPVRLRCEYLENPLGIDMASPHLSWQSDNTERNWKQVAYEVLVSSTEYLAKLTSGTAEKSILRSRLELRITVRHSNRERDISGRVRVWDAAGQVSESAKQHGGRWAFFIAPTGRRSGFAGRTLRMTPTDRGFAGFGCRVRMHLRSCRKLPLPFESHVDLSQKAKDAVLLLATRGDFVAKVNGHEVDAKGRWTTFDRRDISDDLVVGKNEIEVTVTAPESPEFGPNKGVPTTTAALAALVKITSNNGTILRFPTECELEGEHWRILQIGIPLTW